MRKLTCVIFLGLLISSTWLATIDSSLAAPLPPVQTLNFDFGSGPAYAQDDGVLSSPGGTHWNKVPANIANEDNSTIPNTDFKDELGAPTVGIVFSFSPSFASSWQDISTPAFPGPRSDGIQPSSSAGAILTIGRVWEFQELVIYFTSPLNGGFSPSNLSTIVDVPFEPTSNPQLPIFPGVETFDYLRIVDQPPTEGGLGEAPKFTMVLSDPQSNISAIQIRGRFRGLPEPASGLLLAIGLFVTQVAASRTNLRRATSR